jgi:hypothetical protein
VLYLIYQIRKVVDYEMKLYLKNRICPLIFKRTPTLNEIHAILTGFSFIMMLIMYGTVSDMIEKFRLNNYNEYQTSIYGNCRITGFTSEIIDGEHIMSYMCTEMKTDEIQPNNTRYEREQRQLLIDEREIHGNYNYMNQKIRIMRTPSILTNFVSYDIYHRTFKYSPTTREKYRFKTTPYE